MNNETFVEEDVRISTDEPRCGRCGHNNAILYYGQEEGRKCRDCGFKPTKFEKVLETAPNGTRWEMEVGR